MKCLLIAVVISLLSPSYSTEHGEKPIVNTQNGRIRGYEMTSRSGRPFYAFTKIPYAKPPVGPLRFKLSEPADDWKGILQADQNLPHCWQIPVYEAFKSHRTFGTEDCLYLSVFTPKVSEDAKMPVMLFIHGGGFRSELPSNGQASRAKFLMDEDVVHVMIHYRLGPLGFLSLEDSVLPGNLGMKDQNMAIKWVSKNIEKFGGDPKKITLFGNSAGGVSTHLHLISPMSKDLVQGGISQSGSATCLWPLAAPGVAAERTRRFAKYFKCDSDKSEEIVSCLRGKSAYDLTDSERHFTDRDFDPITAFPVVVEKGGENAFLPVSPYKVEVDKPWILGVTSEDGAFKISSYVIYPKLMKSFIQNGPDILSNAISFDNTSSKVEEVSQALFNKYYDEDHLNERFIDLFTDGYFAHGMHQALKLSKGPTYAYLLNHRAKKTALTLDEQHDYSYLGTSHTDELLYLFNFEDENNDPDMKTATDVEVSKRMVKMWTDFAKHGKITEFDWPQYNSEDKKYLKISKENSIESNLWADRMAFWDSLHVRDKVEPMD